MSNAYRDNCDKIFKKKKVGKPSTNLPLRSKDAYWDADKPEIISALNSNIDALDKDALIMLIRELDRRFIQLWDKVAFERKQSQNS